MRNVPVRLCLFVAIGLLDRTGQTGFLQTNPFKQLLNVLFHLISCHLSGLVMDYQSVICTKSRALRPRSRSITNYKIHWAIGRFRKTFILSPCILHRLSWYFHTRSFEPSMVDINAGSCSPNGNWQMLGNPSIETSLVKLCLCYGSHSQMKMSLSKIVHPVVVWIAAHISEFYTR